MLENLLSSIFDSIIANLREYLFPILGLFVILFLFSLVATYLKVLAKRKGATQKVSFNESIVLNIERSIKDSMQQKQEDKPLPLSNKYSKKLSSYQELKERQAQRDAQPKKLSRYEELKAKKEERDQSESKKSNYQKMKEDIDKKYLIRTGGRSSYMEYRKDSMEESKRLEFIQFQKDLEEEIGDYDGRIEVDEDGNIIKVDEIEDTPMDSNNKDHGDEDIDSINEQFNQSVNNEDYDNPYYDEWINNEYVRTYR
ncbi:MAG: hypothetical protein U9N49_10150 [Campylobacterota bacterium]|nr:hypothetical protein [Campylobacterota bacterium]